jgi:periplasmic protein TonB
MFDTMEMKESRNENSRNPLTVVLSLGLHGMILVLLVVIPLIYTEALPVSQIRNYFITAPPSPPAPPPVSTVRIIGVERNVSKVRSNQIQIPTEVPPNINRIVDEGSPDSFPGAFPGDVLGEPQNGPPYGIPQWLPSPRGNPPPLPRPPKTIPSGPAKVHISIGVLQAKLIYGPAPVYPFLAKVNHIQGRVVMEAIISKDGRIQDLQVESGHPLLIRAAIEAVREWRYQPTLLNGQPVEVITTITVNFKLSGS